MPSITIATIFFHIPLLLKCFSFISCPKSVNWLSRFAWTECPDSVEYAHSITNVAFQDLTLQFCISCPKSVNWLSRFAWTECPDSVEYAHSITNVAFQDLTLQFCAILCIVVRPLDLLDLLYWLIYYNINILSWSDPYRTRSLLSPVYSHDTQFSRSSPGTRENSFTLLVTSIKPVALACPAIIMSYGPIGCPVRYNSALI
jgi:hypothetical protein